MNKIICKICGTSYPENASQCPICGFSRSSDLDSFARNSNNDTYTYVKGGRFSKANVKKRNKAAPKDAITPLEVTPKHSKAKKERSNVGMIIVVILLLLAIIAVIGYIALRFFLPNDFLFEGLGNLQLPSLSQQKNPDIIPDEPIIEPEIPEETETLPTDIACTDLAFTTPEIMLDAIGATYQLSVVVTPPDSTDDLFFESDNDTIVTVSETGLLTVVGEGTAVITATCGTVSTECYVVCTLPTTAPLTLTLNRKELTLEEEDQSWILYDGEIPVEEITWTSDDNQIAQIENGKVFAVGAGETTVYGIYDGQTVSCIVRCQFDNNTTGTSGNVTEAGDTTKRTYSLYNPYGFATDVTLKVGEQFPLKLVDENKNEVTAATWTVENENVCSYNAGIVKALRSGTTKVTASCDGSTYTCVVRVN